MKTLFAEFTALPGHEERVAHLMAGLTENGHEFNAALGHHIVEDGSQLTWLTEAE